MFIFYFLLQCVNTLRLLSNVYLNVSCLQDNHKCVAETAVVGYPHEIKGQGNICL